MKPNICVGSIMYNSFYLVLKFYIHSPIRTTLKCCLSAVMNPLKPFATKKGWFIINTSVFRAASEYFASAK